MTVEVDDRRERAAPWPPVRSGSSDEQPGPRTRAAATAGVVRTEAPAAAPSPVPVAVAPAAALQTQPGPKGNSVALNKVAVTGDILTVSMTFSGGECCVHMPIDQVSVIDDATSQRISVLKDNAGQRMAAPLEYGGKSVGPDSFEQAVGQCGSSSPRRPRPA